MKSCARGSLLQYSACLSKSRSNLRNVLPISRGTSALYLTPSINTFSWKSAMCLKLLNMMSLCSRMWYGVLGSSMRRIYLALANFRSRTNSSSVSISSWMVAVLLALASSSGVGPSVRCGRLDLNSRIWANICFFISSAASPVSPATDCLIDETTAACLEISRQRAGT